MLSGMKKKVSSKRGDQPGPGPAIEKGMAEINNGLCSAMFGLVLDEQACAELKKRSSICACTDLEQVKVCARARAGDRSRDCRGYTLPRCVCVCVLRVSFWR